MKNNPVTGMRCLLRGLKLLSHPGLKRYLAVPILVNILVFSFVAWLGIGQFERLFDRFLPESSWLHYFRWILWPIFIFAFLLIIFYTFTVIANLLAAPFNGILAAEAEKRLTGIAPPEAPGNIASEIIPSIASELRKLAYFLIRAIPLLLLFLIPVVQIAAPFLWMAFSAWFLAIEYMDYPMGNHGLRFKQQFSKLRRMRYTALGFGAGVTLMMMVPVLNFAAMPAAVAGATILWCESREDDGLV